ncbi:BAI1-associated protein 3 [Orchesella cincta]|uniref:BAI1-associated protein 3 n=1 Tax=Orchesella cincta TaxID=48709 RepID=A0A1D2NMU5_ORCCI|nr:BAI1-associated protein 3 [Orchesella cincta]
MATFRFDNTARLIRRFSSIKVNFDKEQEETVSKFQKENLPAALAASKCFNDKNEIRKKLQDYIACYSVAELYETIIVSAILPAMKSRDHLDSADLIQHLKQVFKVNEQQHNELMNTAKAKQLPQRRLNMQVMEAKNLPVTDSNGCSDPYCVVFVSSREVARKTEIKFETLNPVWGKKFAFEVSDPSEDVLVLEVMDHNGDESIGKKIKKIKEVRSAKTCLILMKEFAHLRSQQELIGSLRIPISEISSETVERWFQLTNRKQKGDIYLRMVLGYNKCRNTASEEFLQIIHFLLVHELEDDASLDNPFNWDDNYIKWSNYILRQFKWQAVVKPKDVVLAKWRAYTKMNDIFPLKSNMLYLLLNAVLERMLHDKYDSRDISLFWESNSIFVNTVINFLASIHDVLPCSVTVVNINHMIRSVGLLANFLSDSSTSTLHGNEELTTSIISDRVVASLRDGANKFYAKVFADSSSESTHEHTESDPMALYAALEKLLQVGQILHEDLKLGLTTIHTTLKETLNIDYMGIVYQQYDEQFGTAVKAILKKYNRMLHRTDLYSSDTTTEANIIAEKMVESVYKLYLTVKNLAKLAPAENSSETRKISLMHDYHDWFFPSVDKWIDTLRRRIINGIKYSIKLLEENRTSSTDSTDSEQSLHKPDGNVTKKLTISTCAWDAVLRFQDIYKLWTDLDWHHAQQSYIIVKKIIEEVYRYLSCYSEQLLETICKKEPKVDVDEAIIIEYIYEACKAINSINYVREQVELQELEINIPGIIENMRKLDLRSDVGVIDVHFSMTKQEELKRADDVIQGFINSLVKTVLQRYLHLLQDVISAEGCTTMSRRIRRYSANRFRVLQFTGRCWILLYENLEEKNFLCVMIKIWPKVMDGFKKNLRRGIEMGKSSRWFFQTYKDLLFHLSTHWSEKVKSKIRKEHPEVFVQNDLLETRLFFLDMSLVQLKIYYYDCRHTRQQLTPVDHSQHGILTVRACLVEKEECIIVEVINAQNLKPYDCNGYSDPLVEISLMPKESYANSVNLTTKWYRKTLYPQFDEKHTMYVIT